MKTSRYRWFVVAIFFIFILLHQTDKLLIGPLTTPIMETFKIDEAQMGMVFSGAIIVGAICFPLWGILFDLFKRTRLLALASFLWGATTWLSAIARTFPLFLASRASTGIDDSCYPGLYNTVADYFEPRQRGKINGLLGLGQPMGYLLGMALGIFLAASLGWRNVFFITGALGVLLALLIFFFVKEPRRGVTEPELAGASQVVEKRFSFRTVLQLSKKPTLIFIFANSFFGVIPWQVITFWIFRYLETERDYAQGRLFLFMVIVVLILAAGYPIGGALGDFFFRRHPRGRLLVSTAGILLGMVFLALAVTTPTSRGFLFEILLGLTALFMPLAGPNAIATIYDVTEPEVRSTANSLMNFLEQLGSAAAPAIAGLIAVRASLGTAILVICTAAWAICLVFIVIAAVLVPRDIARLRKELQSRAAN